MPRGLHIFVMVHSDPFNSAAILRGVGEYGHRQADWYYTVFNGKREALLPALVRSRCQGALILLGDAQTARKVHNTKIPAVNLIDLAPHELVPGVRPDDAAVGRLAGEHFLAQGFRQVAFYGCSDSWSRTRFEGFREVLKRRGVEPLDNSTGGRFPSYSYANHAERYCKFIARMQKPAAIFACNDGMGSALLSHALGLGIAVPDELAILGADNVERYCTFGKVDMSSIDPDVPQIAYKAAELLAGLMAGGRAPVNPILVPPRRLVARRSTDLLAYEDPVVAAAVRYIREHVGQKMTVGDLLRHTNVSRSWLERRFLEEVGRSPGEEIRRQRLNRARELLLGTSMSLAAIADACGFEYLSHFSAAFKRQFGDAPSMHRARKE